MAQILGIQQGVETPWKTQLTNLKAQDGVWSTLGNGLSTLSTSLQSLTDFEGVLAQKLGSSSDTNVLALSSASSASTAGAHNVVVGSLAQTSSVYTDPVSPGDTLSGTIGIKVGLGPTHTITVDSNSNTIAGLAVAINRAGIGVTASVVQDSGGARLSLTSGTSGAGGQLTITNGLSDTTTSAALTVETANTGADASLTVDGIALTSPSNTVTNAIPGVTFQLLNRSTAPVQVEITNNVSGVTSAVSTLVTAYNAVITALNQQEGKDATGKAEPLYGDPTLGVLQTQLASALLGGAPSGSIASLTQLGVSVNNDGTLAFKSSDFEAALNNNFGDVTGFLQNAGSFGSNFNTVLDGLSATSTTGALYLAQQQNTTQETELNKNVSDQETRIAAQKITLTAQLNAANQILQGIPSQLNQVDEEYSAITGYNKSTSG